MRARPGPEGGADVHSRTEHHPATGDHRELQTAPARLGVPDLMFFIIAASAPLTAVAGGQARPTS